MTEMADSKAIRDAITAAQVEATAIPLREYDADDITVHGFPSHNAVIEIPSFEGFTDFELDLSCLSPPSSPPASIIETDTRSMSPPASPSSRRSISFQSSASHSHDKSPSPRLLPVTPSTVARGSWPLMRYVGRGTPIDRNRRIEWGGIGNEDIGEDGVLFSTVRSTSLDSAIRPSQRSISPEWNILASSPLGRRSSTLPPRNRSRSFAPETVVETPAIKLEGLGTDNTGEWSSLLQTVLGSATTEEATASTSKLPEPPAVEVPKASVVHEVSAKPSMSPEEIRQLNTGLEMDLDIDTALDLALGYRGGMNWFEVGMLPESGRASPSSVYSSHPPSLRPSPPPSVSASDNRSPTSTKAEPDRRVEVKSGAQVWWRRILRRLRKAHFLLGAH
ncbi:hypothetical protein Hypma_006154 [Hypsizygus marmoreus]|uniref:Uncharacterized protein n=1 Tax=Hypsizygus marmoreus TaxID=39966 RepID=A0A369JUQ8_HYPMA|nr:hypothetical protein Hypma_006154 [Hypsizygus marmoreus]